jgi:hypothetical protein
VALVLVKQTAVAAAAGQYGPISGNFVTKFAYETYATPTVLGKSIVAS